MEFCLIIVPLLDYFMIILRIAIVPFQLLTEVQLR